MGLLDASIANKLFQAITENTIAQKNLLSRSEKQTGFHSWAKRRQQGFLLLISPDPANPVKTVPNDLLEFLGHRSGLTMAQFFEADHPFAGKADVALLSAVSKGNFIMNQIVGKNHDVSGVSILCCPQKRSSAPDSDLNHLCATEDQGSMTSEDIKSLSKQRVYISYTQFQLIKVMEHFKVLVDKIFTPESYTAMEITNCLEVLTNEFRDAIEANIEFHGIDFIYSLLGHIHIRMSFWVNRCMQTPDKVTRGTLQFEDIYNALRYSSFMNSFMIKYNQNPPSQPPGKKNDKKRKPSDQGQPGSSSTRTPQPRGKDVVNSDSSTQTATGGRNFSKGMSAFDPDKTKCPTVNGVSACMKWFQRGKCNSTCPRKDSHTAVTGPLQQKVKAYIKNCENKLPAPQAANDTTQG